MDKGPRDHAKALGEVELFDSLHKNSERREPKKTSTTLFKHRQQRKRKKKLSTISRRKNR